jgi:DNA-binding transcriptional LysR family regulator
MDLNRASIFVKVVENGGFTAAARELGVPKSSVSRAVQLLETELGARLLQRSTRRVELTDVGRVFFERAVHAVADIEDAVRAVTDLQATPRGMLRVTAPLDAGSYLLAPLLPRFVSRHPGIQVEVILTSRVVDLLEEHVDFALRAAQVRDGSLVVRRLARIEVGLFAARSYLDERGTPNTTAELAEHDCVLFRPERGRSRWTLSGPNGEETVEVRGPIGADDFSFVHRAVLAGGGIGLLPSFLCADALSTGALVRLLPGRNFEVGSLQLVYPSARHLPRRAAVFRDFIVKELVDSSELLRASSAGSEPR